jgi:hypothetical protein
MNPSNFDELTKGLANSTSRRDAIKTIVAASIGGLFGLGSIRTVFGRNNNCAKWCTAVFGPNTAAASACTSDAAHGRGLCSTCGNVAPSSICCVRNTSGYCNGTAGATCCASGQHCCSGTCSPCCGNSDCPTGRVCQAGQCVQVFEYRCTCNDATQQSICNTVLCGDGDFATFCGDACVDHGGWSTGTCLGGVCPVCPELC